MPRRRRTPAASVVPGRREQRQLAAASAGAAASGSEVHLVGEGGGRHHPHPGAGADHAVVVHPGWADGRRAPDGAAEEAMVEAGGARGAVVAERAGGGVVEVADLRRVMVMVVVAHGREGRVRVAGAGGGAVAGREEGDGPRGEEVLGGGVGAGARGVASPRAPASAAAAAAEALHALEVEAVLLEVGGDVLAREAVDAHQLHYGLGHGVLDAEVRHGVDEALVELRRPHEARALERPRRLVAAAAPSAAAAGARGRRRAAAAAVHVRAAAASSSSTRPAANAAVPRDVEGDGEIGRDERLGQRHQLVRPGQLLLAAREPAGLLLLPHGDGLLTPPPRVEQSNSCGSLGRGSGSSSSSTSRLDSKRGREGGERKEEGLLRGGSLFFSLLCVCLGLLFSSP
ncbi:hypothetical protein HU200_008121 [Digitaria exilis]|uniref:Uncharacterized protein n=1 Tax=Digitaria exilis TaxID=1010633 RepID=A0A835KRR2_9POAL|nr:hypothetical protein HU200_008121 [Digitaria exilis]